MVVIRIHDDPAKELGFIKRQFGRAISKILSRQEQTGVDLADKLGVSRQYVNQLISGTSGMSMGSVRKVVDALGCKLTITIEQK